MYSREGIATTTQRSQVTEAMRLKLEPLVCKDRRGSWYDNANVGTNSQLLDPDGLKNMYTGIAKVLQKAYAPQEAARELAEKYVETMMQDDKVDWLQVQVQNPKVVQLVNKFLTEHPSWVMEASDTTTKQYGAEIRRGLITETRRLLDVYIMYKAKEDRDKQAATLAELAERVRQLEHKPDPAVSITLANNKRLPSTGGQPIPSTSG